MSCGFIGACVFLLAAASTLTSVAAAKVAREHVSVRTRALASAGAKPGYSAKPRDGLFCFIVIAAEFGDVPRAKNVLDHDDKDAGFTGCDEFRIYSNVSHIRTLSDHRRCTHCVEQAINGSMDVPVGQPNWTKAKGWPATALNVPIFRQVWQHVFATAPYKEYAWTVKTEVEVVFVATYLRNYLLALPAIVEADGKAEEASSYKIGKPAATRLSEQAAFGVNAADALYGPVEVLTSFAVAAYAAKPEECDKVAEDNPRIGEDWWLHLCMGALGLPAIRQDRLLLDDGSSLLFDDANHKFSYCGKGVVAYHPRKEIEDWNRCYDEILTAGEPEAIPSM